MRWPSFERARRSNTPPDFQVSVTTEPDDPAYANGTLWGMHNTGLTATAEGGYETGLDDADIDAPEGWSTRTDASSVIVAVIDSGIRRPHQDLAANMWVNTAEISDNDVDDDGNGYVDDYHGLNALTYVGLGGTLEAGDPDDDNGHGTHCAGIMGARGDNGIGVAGVAWNVKLMVCKFLNSGGI